MSNFDQRKQKVNRQINIGRITILTPKWLVAVLATRVLVGICMSGVLIMSGVALTYNRDSNYTRLFLQAMPSPCDIKQLSQSSSVSSQQSEIMLGKVRIAVSGFYDLQQRQVTNNSKALAIDFANDLRDEIQKEACKPNSDLNHDDFTVWGPDNNVPSIAGFQDIDRQKSARAIATDINAQIIIYAEIDTVNNSQQSLITPTYVVVDDNFFQAGEIVGPHRMGEEILINGKPDSTSSMVMIRDSLVSRVVTLANILIGLGFHANNTPEDLARANHYYEAAHENNIWADDNGREVLYLLQGDIALAQGNFNLAKMHFQMAINQNNDYPRAYIGLAQTYYLEVITKYNQKQTNKLDMDDELLLLKSTELYSTALSLIQKPDIWFNSPKIHFGLGRIHTLRFFSDCELDECSKESARINALQEYQAIIDLHKNPDASTNRLLRTYLFNAFRGQGIIYEATGEYDRALWTYKEAKHFADNLTMQHTIKEAIERIEK